MFFDPKNLWKRKKTCFFLLEFLRSARCFFWYRPPVTSPPPVPPVPDPWTTERPLSCIFNVGKPLDGVILRGDDNGYAWRNQKAARHTPRTFHTKPLFQGVSNNQNMLERSLYVQWNSYYRYDGVRTTWGKGAKKTKCRAQNLQIFFAREKKSIDSIRRELSPLCVCCCVECVFDLTDSWVLSKCPWACDKLIYCSR